MGHIGTVVNSQNKYSKLIPSVKKGKEILYIFFGIHTANAVLPAERLLEGRQEEAA